MPGKNGQEWKLVAIQLPGFSLPPDAPSWASAMAKRLADTFSIIGTYLQRVGQSETVPATSPTTADEPFIVPHNLGVTPRNVYALPAADGTLKATDDDLREWGPKQIKVRFSTASTRLRLTIVA
jgi:hypothetical protein